MQAKNRQWVLAARPDGLVKTTDFAWAEGPVPEPGPGEFLVRVHYLSLAPVMRRYMIDGAGIEKPLAFGDVMHGRGAGMVVKSNHPDFAVGDAVHGPMGWQDYKVLDGTRLTFKVRQRVAPLHTALGCLGITGFTAYIGLFDLCEPKPGQTVLVSGAAGGVGSIVGPLAKIAGCRVIGIAGGPEKCARLTSQLGYDAAIDYRNSDVAAEIAKAAPEGINIYFDNVGGPVTDAALGHLADKARVAVCGQISQYLATGELYGIRNFGQVLKKHARIEGFFVYLHADRFEEAETRMSQWVADGRLPILVDIKDGLEQMPAALRGLYLGENIGKQVVRVAPDPW